MPEKLAIVCLKEEEKSRSLIVKERDEVCEERKRERERERERERDSEKRPQRESEKRPHKYRKKHASV